MSHLRTLRGNHPRARLPGTADVAIETVGRRPGRTRSGHCGPAEPSSVTSATAGTNPRADLARVFYLQQRILGSTGCTRPELVAMLRTMDATGVRPVIDRARPLREIDKGLQLMLDGQHTGKIVVHPPTPHEQAREAKA
ncbi:zinc-binding dehydrogenase [Frankia sp. CcI49]|uniref:zinc-binding dehydrogenase n=1 Tax=Frankia sp. CcI49 TaxID=1745382 RepID=UPI0013046E9C|nr:zinc-binding dehydrogenase [Frankia sp. CcI49]